MFGGDYNRQSKDIKKLLNKYSNCCQSGLFKDNITKYVEKQLAAKINKNRSKQIRHLKDIMKEHYLTKLVHVNAQIS